MDVGRGRKPLYADGTLADPVWVRLPEKTDAIVRKMAAEDEVDVSAMIRRLVHQALGLGKIQRFRKTA